MSDHGPVAGPPAGWDLIVRPVKSARISVAVAALMLVTFAVIAAFLPDEQDGVTFTRADQWGVFGVGILISCGILAFIRPRVRVGRGGVETRSFFGGPRLVEWAVILRVDFLPKTRFARLILPGDEALALYAIQRGDGERSVQAMSQLRELHATWGPQI